MEMFFISLLSTMLTLFMVIVLHASAAREPGHYCGLCRLGAAMVRKGNELIEKGRKQNPALAARMLGENDAKDQNADS